MNAISLTSFLVCVSFIFSPFSIFPGFNLAYIFILFMLLWISKKGFLKLNYASLILFFLLFFKLVTDVFSGEGSASSLNNYVVLFFVCVFTLCKLPESKYSNAPKYFIYTILIHSTFLICQSLLANFIGVTDVFNPFGVFSPFGPDPSSIDPAPYNPEYQSYKRPNGFNWEPSAAALWTILGISVLLNYSGFTPRLKNISLGVLIFSVVCTASMSGMLLLVLYLVAHHLICVDNKKSIKTYFLSMLIVFSVFALYFTFYDVVEGRFSEISTEGSSGYLRITAPFMFLYDSFSFLGAEELGGKAFQSSVYFHADGRNSLSGIANTYIQLLYYFGLVGFFALIFCLLKVLYSLVKFKSKTQLSMVICVSLLLNMGGYLFNPIMVYSFFVYIYIFKVLNNANFQKT